MGSVEMVGEESRMIAVTGRRLDAGWMLAHV